MDGELDNPFHGARILAQIRWERIDNLEGIGE